MVEEACALEKKGEISHFLNKSIDYFVEEKWEGFGAESLCEAF